MKRCVVVGLSGLLLATSALAEEKHRQLDAHEHGHSSFNMAIDGKVVNMELEAPGADIVGFEYKPSTKKQKAAMAAAKKTLKEISNVVGLPAAAGCKLGKANVEVHFEGGEEEKKHAKKKSKHSHGHSHSHKKKKKEKEAGHSEFHVTYKLTCSAPERLVEIAFPFFKSFEGAQELEVNVIGAKSQKKFEVERDSAKINLSGVI